MLGYKQIFISTGLASRSAVTMMTMMMMSVSFERHFMVTPFPCEPLHSR